MPDGDIVQCRLRRLYQKPYKWLCEGVATSDQCARLVLEQLKKDIKAKGNLPVVLAQAMAASVAQIICRFESANENDFSRLSIEFGSRTQIVDGPHHLKELTSRAGKHSLNDLRNGREEDIVNVAEVIFTRYRTYVSKWDTIEPQVSGNFLSQVIDQPISQDFQMAIQ